MCQNLASRELIVGRVLKKLIFSKPVCHISRVDGSAWILEHPFDEQELLCQNRLLLCSSSIEVHCRRKVKFFCKS